jgi:hypothetical protein
MTSLNDYKGMLPYASELFGIYQPLLGWKSQIIQRRYDRFRSSLYTEFASRALIGSAAPVQIRMANGGRNVFAHSSSEFSFDISNLKPVDFTRSSEPYVSSSIDSATTRMIVKDLGPLPPKDWRDIISPQRMDDLLNKLKDILSHPGELQQYPDLKDYVDNFVSTHDPGTEAQALLQDLFAKECKISGYLLFLSQHAASNLTALFYRSPKSALLDLAQLQDPLLNFGTNSYDAILSPIGIIHLYREYFFEFESFLGPPCGHVWLSPGGTVELIEVSTRRTLTEKSLEQSLETVAKSETEVTTQDELADAVKEENRNNVKFGFTNTASYSSPVFSDTATADFSLDNNKSNSRETTHKQMRQQSEKLSSEIKRNFKTTFKTSLEITDTASKRYVIQNTTDKLVNYELRRKMRKVGVQVQDIGVSLCWHTFVDDPGHDLGVAKLVHIGKPPELGDLVQPDAPEMPTAKTQDANINIPFVQIGNADNDGTYADGTQIDPGFLQSPDYILADFDQRVTFSTPGFTLTAVDLDPQGADAKLSVRNLQSADGSSAGTFTIHLDYVSWNKQPSIPVKATLHWEPSAAARDAVTAQYNARMDQYNVEKARRYKEAFYQAARDRIKLASQITPRDADVLREEERDVVYRTLISELMSVGTHQSKHVTSELVRSIFDVDSMLYFVAPEWWMPRLHRSAQHLGEEPGTPQPPAGGGVVRPGTGGLMLPALAGLKVDRRSGFAPVGGWQLAGADAASSSAERGTGISADNIVDWGGAKELGRDNYYITEDSIPAKLGSSLGWLLQLDGDNLRNAFLNSPWVKAVIPIRIGKERDAINWLQQAHVEGSDGLDAEYVASPNDPPELKSTPGHTVTLGDALSFLIDKIEEFDRNSRTPIVGNPADPEDASNHYAGSLPTEAVFEHGFYPLKGGVRFDQSGTEQAIFSQWIEILPTDQVAALAVEYDPKTLQVKEPPS